MEQTTTVRDKVALMREVLDAVVAAVEVGGTEGVPGGTLYASLMAHGCSLRQFESIMSALVKAGRLKKNGHHYSKA